MITNQAVYELEKFRYDNVQPPALQQYLTTPVPPETPDAEFTGDTEELKKYILFAAQSMDPVDRIRATPILPRTVEAHRVLQLISDEDGEALFDLPPTGASLDAEA